MGTHPIFESDFDCLTDFRQKMAARPVVTVYGNDGKRTGQEINLPLVFKAPIRPDVVTQVHTGLNKNNRQPYAVSSIAGEQTSAESWGTGRAVARIPRVRGGGTHRSGQGAFGNMCRGGHMFGSKKQWRRIHRKVNIKQKRYAVVSAVAASGSPSIVMSKGHQINRMSEIPLVVDDQLESLKKTKDAVTFLKKHKVWPDIVRVYRSKTNRAGKGKLRNRRTVQKKGPLVIYAKNEGLTLAFRNIPGVDTMCVDKLNLLKLAPGGRVGRLCIWSEGAFKMLDSLYGTYFKKSELKTDYNLPKPIMTKPDIMAIFKDERIRKHLKAPKLRRNLSKIKLNPLRNERQLMRLNPYAAVEKNLARIMQAKGIARKAEKMKRIEVKERLARRKANTIPANKAAKKAAKEAADTKRHAKAAKVMKKLMEKTRKPRKAESEKTPRTAEEAKEFRAKKAALYKTKAVSARKAIKGAKKVAAQPKAAKTVTKEAFKARKNLKKALASKAANLDHIPEEVAARSRARM